MTETVEEITALADRLYREREQLERVRRSLLILDSSPAVYETLWRKGRAHFFLGQEASDEREARGHHLAGTKDSRLAVRAFKDGVEGHFWLGVNLALLAGLEKPLKALPHAVRAKRELKRAASIDSSYHAAGPLRVLARLESKLPRILGGGHARARLHFEEALRRAPANTVTRLYFAELLMECGESTRAQAELEAILTIPFNPDWAFEIKRDRKRAREIIAKAE